MLFCLERGGHYLLLALHYSLHETGSGKAYHLTGHKWFTSAPMSDAFLVGVVFGFEALRCGGGGVLIIK